MTERSSLDDMWGLAANSYLWHSCKICHDEKLTCSH